MRIQDHFGKPTAQKISEDVEVRNWDPTDPDEKNPWKKYVDKTPEPTDTQSNTNKTDKTNKANTNTTNNTNTNTNKRE